MGSPMEVEATAMNSEFQLEMIGRRKKVRSLFEQGLTVREVMSRTGLTKGKVDWAGSYS